MLALRLEICLGRMLRLASEGEDRNGDRAEGPRQPLAGSARPLPCPARAPSSSPGQAVKQSGTTAGAGGCPGATGPCRSCHRRRPAAVQQRLIRHGLPFTSPRALLARPRGPAASRSAPGWRGFTSFSYFSSIASETKALCLNITGQGARAGASKCWFPNFLVFPGRGAAASTTHAAGGAGWWGGGHLAPRGL